jgi:hypothetical protein
LGQGLPDAVIDNFNWASALSFYDYDAMVVDPSAGVSQVIESVLRGEGEFQTYDDVPVLDGPTSAESVGLADLLRRRRDETETLLARGGLVVCFGYPDVPHSRVGGFTGAHRFYWLPAPTGCDYGPDYVRAASGRHLSVVDWEHPFANFLDARRNDILYRASFAEGARGFPGARVIARSSGGTAIAIDVPVGGGRVIFVPAPPQHQTSSERSRFASDLVAAIRNTLLTSAEGNAPDWIEDEKLPGLDEARRSMEDAEAQLDELEAELDKARNEYRGIDRYRRLLWQEGKYGFELPVRDALALLGFSQYSTPDTPATFSLSSEVVYVEAESSGGVIGMDPHYRLRSRIEAKIADDGNPPRGILVINGFREVAPGEREQQYTNSLRVAAESMRYCLVQATDLFEAVRDKLEGKGDAAAFAKRLMQTEGLLSPEPAPAEATATD